MSAKNNSRTGQSGLEFLVTMALALLLFTATYSVFIEKKQLADQNQRQQDAEEIADKTAFNLDLALTEGNGYSRSFELPQDIDGEDYNVTIGEEIVLVEYLETSTLATTAVNSIDGTVKPGENTVKNLEGTINVSQP